MSGRQGKALLFIGIGLVFIIIAILAAKCGYSLPVPCLSEPRVDKFTIDQLRPVDSTSGRVTVAGDLEGSCSVPLDDLQVVVYYIGIAPTREERWHRSDLDCLTHIGNGNWVVSSDCDVRLSGQYSEFLLIAVLVEKTKASQLSSDPVAADGEALRNQLCKYAYLCGASPPCSSISPEKRILNPVRPTETPVMTTASPTFTSTPSPSPTYTPTELPALTVTPTRTMPTNTPTRLAAPILIAPETGRCYGGHLIFSWRWYRQLSDEGPYGGEWFALRVWREGGEKKSRTWTKETSYELVLEPPDFVGDPNIRYLWNVAVVRQTGEPRSEHWEYVSPESEVRWFCIHSTAPEPPTPTFTPTTPPPTQPPEPTEMPY